MRFSHHPAERRPLLTTGIARRRGGYVLVMFALLLIPLLLMVGFAVDVGYWYNRGNDIQKAADAAALAGVVWLPDIDKATAVAIDTAARNGYSTSDPNITVVVQKSAKSPRRLQVAIRDKRVGSFFYSKLGGSDLDMSRTADAEYVTPVPMGSPRNYFGLGTLLVGHSDWGSPEYLYQSVNPYCTQKENGDQFQSGFIGAKCTGSANSEYRTTGYEFYIEAPKNRPSAIDVRLYDPRYNPNSFQASCTLIYNSTYTTSNSSSNVTITGPAMYSIRNSTSSSWGTDIVLAPGATYTRAANLLRYRAGSCSEAAEAAVDEKRLTGNEDYTYTLYQADDTPLDDSDNPQICQKTFSLDTPFDGYTYLGSSRWNTLCSISTAQPSGKYILRVTNGGIPRDASTNDGSNQWGLVAKYTSVSGAALCDGRTDSTCPRVYAKDAMSVKAATTASVASFYLAEIAPVHAGKKLRIELFDPGEGGSTIEIMRPTGTNSWTPQTVTWTSEGASPSSGSGASIDVTNSRFNGKLVKITVDLTGYNPPTDNNWWQIRYTFAGTVTDRTTWSARILGDPVHLVDS